jgi:hypothetical protein
MRASSLSVGINFCDLVSDINDLITSHHQAQSGAMLEPIGRSLMRCSPQQTLTSELLIETGLIASAIDLPPGSRL